MKPANRRELITATEEILDNFDFKKVKKVMRFLEWTYANKGDGKPFKPKMADIIDTAEKVIEWAIKSAQESATKTGYSATGGFHATADLTESNPYLTLAFQIETMENYYEDPFLEP